MSETDYAPEGYFTNAQPIIIFNGDNDQSESSTNLGQTWNDNGINEAQLVSGVDYVGLNQFLRNLGRSSAQAATLLEPQTEANRVLDVSSEAWIQDVEFRRPSTIRLFGHAFEWAGYLNYSKGLPQYQQTLTTSNQFTYYFTNEDGGKVYGSGFNQNGQLVSPRGIEDVTTGETLDLENIGNPDRPIDIPPVDQPWTQSGGTLVPTIAGSEVTVVDTSNAVNVALEPDGDSFFSGKMNIGGDFNGTPSIEFNSDGTSGDITAAQGRLNIDSTGTTRRPGTGGDYYVLGAKNKSGTGIGAAGGYLAMYTDVSDGTPDELKIRLAGVDGTAFFAGEVEIGGTDVSPNIDLNADVSAVFDGPNTSLSVIGYTLGRTLFHAEAYKGGAETFEVSSSDENILLTATNTKSGENSAGFIFRTRDGLRGTLERMRLTNTGNLLIGGSLPTDPNIQLLKDGSAFFAGGITNIFSNGTVRVGDNPSNEDEYGIDLNNKDNIRIRTTETYALQIYPSSGETTEVINLSSDGGADFAGTVTIGGTPGSPNVEIRPDGVIIGRDTFGLQDRSTKQQTYSIRADDDIVHTAKQGKKLCMGTSSNGLTATRGVELTSGATAWSTWSDERYKTDLVKITDGLNKVSSLRAVTGKYKDDELGITHPFLIAQDVQKVLPEAVDDSWKTKDKEKSLSLRYTEVIPLLVSALHDAKDRIEALEAEVKALKGA